MFGRWISRVRQIQQDEGNSDIASGVEDLKAAVEIVAR